MEYIKIFLILLFAGCNQSSNLQPEDTKVSRSAEMQKEIDYILDNSWCLKNQNFGTILNQI